MFLSTIKHWITCGFVILLKYSVGIYRSLSAGGLACCRFHPSCSKYMVESLDQHGIKGLYLTVKRLSRCHPWGKVEYDPVPKKKQFGRNAC